MGRHHEDVQPARAQRLRRYRRNIVERRHDRRAGSRPGEDARAAPGPPGTPTGTRPPGTSVAAGRSPTTRRLGPTPTGSSTPPSAAGSSARGRPRPRDDLKRIWPDVVFSADNYAALAVMDGADPMNQRTNDIPATHVFLDWGIGRLGTLAGLYIEKSLRPDRSPGRGDERPTHRAVPCPARCSRTAIAGCSTPCSPPAFTATGGSTGAGSAASTSRRSTSRPSVERIVLVNDIQEVEQPAKALISARTRPAAFDAKAVAFAYNVDVRYMGDAPWPDRLRRRRKFAEVARLGHGCVSPGPDRPLHQQDRLP